MDCVIGLNDWIRITDGTAIVCHQEWNILGSQLCFADLAQLVLKILDNKLKFGNSQGIIRNNVFHYDLLLNFNKYSFIRRRKNCYGLSL